MAQATSTEWIHIKRGATVSADWLDRIESTLLCESGLYVEARLEDGRWVYILNDRQYSCAAADGRSCGAIEAGMGPW